MQVTFKVNSCVLDPHQQPEMVILLQWEVDGFISTPQKKILVPSIMPQKHTISKWDPSLQVNYKINSCVLDLHLGKGMVIFAAVESGWFYLHACRWSSALD